MRLGLKGPQQEQEMVTVIVGCALRERTHNPYYSHLLDRLCGVDRKYQVSEQEVPVGCVHMEYLVAGRRALWVEHRR